jgi:hypothetical protein
MQTAIQTFFTNVSNQLTLVNKEQEDDTLHTEYKCNVDVVLAGDSIWDCELTEVTITSINIAETEWNDGDISSVHIGVAYTVNGASEVEGSWRLYSDSGFTEAVSTLLGTDVSFTEQGMQENNYASMEL